MDLLGHTARLSSIAVKFEEAKHAAIEKAVEIAVEAAKDRIGHDNPAVGPVPAWDPLAPSTMETREALGFSSDETLLRTGALQDSIEGGVEGLTGYVGSPMEEALWAEEGTPTQPPRSYLVGGFYDKKAEIEQAVGGIVVKVTLGK